jgi:hypothetical protein
VNMQINMRRVNSASRSVSFAGRDWLTIDIARGSSRGS